ncbi:MAG: response regulator, partial [Bdellovibrionota bacterium]
MSGELFSEALLVEDEKSLQTALEIALKKLGIHCRVASNLTQARKLFAEKLPPFILLDRTLPDGDGLTLCRSLREEGYTGA